VSAGAVGAWRSMRVRHRFAAIQAAAWGCSNGTRRGSRPVAAQRSVRGEGATPPPAGRRGAAPGGGRKDLAGRREEQVDSGARLSRQRPARPADSRDPGPAPAHQPAPAGRARAADARAGDQPEGVLGLRRRRFADSCERGRSTQGHGERPPTQPVDDAGSTSSGGRLRSPPAPPGTREGSRHLAGRYAWASRKGRPGRQPSCRADLRDQGPTRRS